MNMDIEYNTQLEPLTIKEYGRNVQRMVAHTMSLEDKDQRTLAAQGIVKVMEYINPDPKKGADHEQKLWDHLHVMANYELDVDAPYEKPSPPENLEKEISKPDYPKGRIRYRHYGKIVENLVQITKAEKDPESRKKMEAYLGGYMKLAYKQWNEQKMSDDVIIQNILDMSDGEVKLTEIVDITESVPTNTSNSSRVSAFGARPSSNFKKKRKKKKIRR